MLDAVVSDSLITGARPVCARLSSPSCIRPESMSIRQVARIAWPMESVGISRRGATRATGIRDPLQAPSRANSPRAAAASGSDSSTPICAAMASRTRWSGNTAPAPSAVSNVRGLPSQSTKVPGLSTTGATGNTTSARSVTALWRSSRLTTNADRSTASSAPCGSGRSSGSIPAVIRARSGPVSASIAAVSRPASVGSSVTPHTAATSARAAASATGRPPGSRFGNAPASRAPRSPARRGIHARFAPVSSANFDAADNAPGTEPSRSPTSTIAPGLRRSWAIDSVPRSPTCSASSHCGSSPGIDCRSTPSSLRRPRLAQGAIDATTTPRVRRALRNLRNISGDSSSGSNPTINTTGAFSRSE